VDEEMITTVTTTTTTVATTTTTTVATSTATTAAATTATTATATISIAASLAIIGTIVLISLLIVKELLSYHRLERTLFLSNRLNIAILPLLMMFVLIVVTKIVENF
jgi:hypothetical protein